MHKSTITSAWWYRWILNENTFKELGYLISFYCWWFFRFNIRLNYQRQTISLRIHFWRRMDWAQTHNHYLNYNYYIHFIIISALIDIQCHRAKLEWTTMSVKARETNVKRLIQISDEDNSNRVKSSISDQALR